MVVRRTIRVGGREVVGDVIPVDPTIGQHLPSKVYESRDALSKPGPNVLVWYDAIPMNKSNDIASVIENYA